jgi:hypothetical protein
VTPSELRPFLFRRGDRRRPDPRQHRAERVLEKLESLLLLVAERDPGCAPVGQRGPPLAGVRRVAEPESPSRKPVTAVDVDVVAVEAPPREDTAKEPHGAGVAGSGLAALEEDRGVGDRADAVLECRVEAGEGESRLTVVVEREGQALVELAAEELGAGGEIGHMATMPGALDRR